MFAEAIDTPQRAKAVCREITEQDLPAVVAMLSDGFKSFEREVWANFCRRLAERSSPEGYPRFGWCLDDNGSIVGSIFTIHTEVRTETTPEIRCSTSSWYVDPKYRGMGMRLSRQAVKFRNVNYINPTYGEGTRPVMDVLGFKSYCSGNYLALALLSPSAKKVRVSRYESQGDYDLTAWERKILSDHRDFGCISLVCRSPAGDHPFVFLRRTRYLPYAQLLYCRETSDIVTFAGPLGRYLAMRGLPFIAIDSNAPIAGLIGRFFDGKPLFYKGLAAPRLNDLAYTELALLAKN
jgi:hypothetical protein